MSTTPKSSSSELKPTFNSKECVDYLQKGWQDTLAQLQDSKIPQGEKPEVYHPPNAGEKATAWGSGSGPWGKKDNNTATGQDFLRELWRAFDSKNSPLNNSKK